MKDLKFTIVASTGGSVMNELFKNSFFKTHIFSVVSDRDCLALSIAQKKGIKTQVYLEKSKDKFSDYLNTYLQENNIDYIISFYTKLFTGELLYSYKYKIINLHPSILPAFKGLNSFRDTIQYGTKYVGSTIHFIDEQMDEGKIIIQTVYPINPHFNIDLIRHKIFQHQSKSLLQVVKWLTEERIIIINNQVIVKNAQYSDFEFCPNLDFEEAINLNIPFNDQKNND